MLFLKKKYNPGISDNGFTGGSIYREVGVKCKKHTTAGIR
jgi:hypothetical protein